MPAASRPPWRGCLRLAPLALALVLRQLRPLLCIVGAMLVLVAASVVPAYQEAARRLDHQPAAAGRFGRLLLDDLERLYPEACPPLGAAALVALLLWTFFAGGVVGCVGALTPSKRRATAFLAQCGRSFFRSLRCCLVFLGAVMLWSWLSLGLLRPLAEAQLSPFGDERALFWFEIGVNAGWLLGFALLWIVRRLALADLLLSDRRSALLASMRGVWLLARRPLRAAAAYGPLFVLFGLGLAIAGLAVDRLAAADQLPWAGLAGLAALVLYQTFLAASFVVARLLTEHVRGGPGLDG